MGDFKSLSSSNTYNEHLFSKGWKKYLHEGRFLWLQKNLAKATFPVKRIIELGCFDARSVYYLPPDFEYYQGYDADWHGGLDLGKKTWKENPKIKLTYCQTPDSFNSNDEKFDVSISLETLEHLWEKDLEDFVARLSAATRHLCFISVPNEKGLVFFFKHLSKVILGVNEDTFSMQEFFWASIGQLDKVERLETGHKGFDYDNLILLLEKYFFIESIEGIPFSFLSHRLNFTVGVICRPKNRAI